jgi:hypothetical protein
MSDAHFLRLLFMAAMIVLFSFTTLAIFFGHKFMSKISAWFQKLGQPRQRVKLGA